MIKTLWTALIFVSGLGSAACDRVAGDAPSPYQGVVELDQLRLSGELGGRLVTVDVVRGQRVRAGQRIATLDDAILRSGRAARAAELEAAEAQLALLAGGARPEDLLTLEAQVRSSRANEQTLATLRARQRRLVADSAAPEATLDELDGRLKAARSQREAAQHQLAALRSGARTPELDLARARVAAATALVLAEDLRLDKLTLLAPRAGTILEVLLDPGEVVGAGVPIALLGDLEHPYVDVFVSVAAVAPLALGAPAQVLIDGLPAMAARIEHIGQTTEFTPRFVFNKEERAHLVVRVRLRIDDPQHLLHPGLPAFAIFGTARAATR